MKLNVIVALVASASLMVACGSTVSPVTSSSPVKAQSIDSSGGEGGDGGAAGGILLGNPYPVGTQLATIPRGSGDALTVTMNWRAVGFTYDWYDRPGVELKVCGLNQSGAAVSCNYQNASFRASGTNDFTTTFSCILSPSVVSLVVYGSDTSLHPGGRSIYVTRLDSVLGLPLLPGPLPSVSPSYPVC